MEGGEASGGSVATTGEGEASGDDVTSAVAAAKRRKSERPELQDEGRFYGGPKDLALVRSYHPRAGDGVARACRSTGSLFRNI